VRDWFIWGGVALCLFSLWVIARRDWIRLTRPSRQVQARVTGHRLVTDSDGPTYAACFTFEAEGGRQLAHSDRRMQEGEAVTLFYPEGRPDLARLPRPLMWAAAYVGLAALAVVLAVEGLWPGTIPRS
jgi:hypothetical protein